MTNFYLVIFSYRNIKINHRNCFFKLKFFFFMQGIWNWWVSNRTKWMTQFLNDIFSASEPFILKTKHRIFVPVSIFGYYRRDFEKFSGKWKRSNCFWMKRFVYYDFCRWFSWKNNFLIFVAHMSLFFSSG